MPNAIEERTTNSTSIVANSVRATIIERIEDLNYSELVKLLNEVTNIKYQRGRCKS